MENIDKIVNDKLSRKWSAINARCTNNNDKYYKYYGGRGIRCRWNSFEDFKNDMAESYILHSTKYGYRQTSIERIDNDGDYYKDNCTWATFSEQNKNRRGYGKSSYKYISFDKDKDRWRVQKPLSDGSKLNKRFETEDEAVNFLKYFVEEKR